MTSRLERSQLLARSIEEVFGFFSDPANLGAITPAWLHFEVVASSTPSVCAGTVLDYKLRLHGIPLRWRSLISVWEPPRRFVDEQVRGPYRSWRHEHRFEALGERTRVVDTVSFSAPGGLLVERLLLRTNLKTIFDHRARALAQRFGEVAD